MSKRDGFHLPFYRDTELALPEDENERREAARSLLGADLVSCSDSWIEAAQRQIMASAAFATFTPEQREATLSLVGYAAYGVLHSVCVRLDRFDHGDLEIHLVEADDDGEPIRSTRIAGVRDTELHHDYRDWAEKFGDHFDPDAAARFHTPSEPD